MHIVETGSEPLNKNAMSRTIRDSNAQNPRSNEGSMHDEITTNLFGFPPDKIHVVPAIDQFDDLSVFILNKDF